MSRVQLALNVTDLDAAVAFYSKLFGAEPAKRRPGYANFAIVEPPLKLVLIEEAGGRGHGVTGALNHLGVEVSSTEEVHAATRRLSAEGLEPDVQDSTTCCYALQDKAWVNDPDGAPWEVYTVLADAPEETDLGCSTEGCAPDGVAGDPDRRHLRAVGPRQPAASHRCRNRFERTTFMNDAALWRRLVAELLGSAFLAAIVIGSGIAAQQLSPGQHRARAVRERGRDGGRALRHHLDVRAGLGGALQPGCLVRRRRLWRPELARRLRLSARPGGGLPRRRRRCQPDVLEGGGVDLDPSPGHPGPFPVRGRGHTRSHPGHLRPGPQWPEP